MTSRPSPSVSMDPLPVHEARPARAIIDQAIRENRMWEYLLFASSATFLVVGTILAVKGIVTTSFFSAFAGTVFAALCLPAAKMAQSIRRHNMDIRLLEAILTKATTVEEATIALERILLKTDRTVRDRSPESDPTDSDDREC